MGLLGCVFGLGVLGCIDFSGSRLSKDGYHWNQRNKDGRNVLNLVNQKGAAQSIRDKFKELQSRSIRLSFLQVTVFFVAGGWEVCGVCIANHSYLYKL